jgi:DNA invertase Pin-like site-specific DNA recombinase
MQNDRSVADQFALCRSYCAREGLTVVAEFSDAARSGASIIGRDGLIAFIEQARKRAFDVLVVEALDRVSRDMEDLAWLHKRLPLMGIELRSVHEGKADTVTVGLRGLVGQLFREDGAKKIRRGMTGVVREGRHAGGRAYGYRAVAGTTGRLTIDEAEAAIVRRIFAELATGRSPRHIAHNLNHDGVPPPRGARWNASTINGNRARGSGILLNELYVGRLVWNRVRMVRDPDTGKRISRPNPKAEHMAVEAAHLRIIDDTLFEAAQARRRALAPAARARPRRPHMLSGLIRCGACGAGMCVHDRDRTGRIRVRCSAVRESASCGNRSRYYLDRIEGAVLEGMRAELTHPAAITEYLHTYNQTRRQLAAKAQRNRSRQEAKLAEAERELDRALNALIKGRLSDDEADRILPLIRERIASAKAGLASLEELPKSVALHPGAVAAYLGTVDRLAESLRDHTAAGGDRGSLIADFRALVESVTVHRTATGFDVEVKGKLAALIGGDAFPQGVGVSVVAEERYRQNPVHTGHMGDSLFLRHR